MATHAAPVNSGPPFPLTEPVGAPWREQALTQIGEQRFVLIWLTQLPGAPAPSEAAVKTINDHWHAASVAAKRRSRGGAGVERVTSHLDAVDCDLLRLAPQSYVRGRLPGLVGQTRKLLSADDPRRVRIEAVAGQPETAPLTDADREIVLAATHAAGAERRREVGRLRSFQRILLLTAAAMLIGAIGVGVFAAAFPDKLPVCFTPGTTIVCPTSAKAIVNPTTTSPTGQPTEVRPDQADAAMRRYASGWDLIVVEGVGLLAAALAAAASLRTIRGSSTPFGLPIALALLKLPTGALTAVLGLILMRGDFVPGLSALDSPAQILSWAVVFGYSQQLLTRSVDQRAQRVIDDFGRTHEQREIRAGTAPAHPAPAGPS
jgi:hypothetical protein